MARIKVKNLLLRTYIGINPDEQINKQDVLINFEIETFVPQKALDSDALEFTLNYKSITKRIIELVQNDRFNLLEVLTNKILDLIFDDDKVQWAQVEVDKPHALRFAESVSVTMERSRNAK